MFVFSLLHKGRKDTAAVKNIMMRFPDFFFVLSFRLETGYPVGGFVLLFFGRGFVAAWQQFFVLYFCSKVVVFKAFQAFLLFLSSFYLLLGLEPHRINFSC